jgi:hypothetical protein
MAGHAIYPRVIVMSGPEQTTWPHGACHPIPPSPCHVVNPFAITSNNSTPHVAAAATNVHKKAVWSPDTWAPRHARRR